MQAGSEGAAAFVMLLKTRKAIMKSKTLFGSVSHCFPVSLLFCRQPGTAEP